MNGCSEQLTHVYYILAAAALRNAAEFSSCRCCYLRMRLTLALNDLLDKSKVGKGKIGAKLEKITENFVHFGGLCHVSLDMKPQQGGCSCR